MHYLGIYLLRSRSFASSVHHAITFFFTFNAIFGKIGRKLSDEVILKLFKTKCVQVLCTV
jgi:hypothetical protein